MTPAGNSINDTGIAPTMEIKLSVDDFNKNLDPQLKKAVEVGKIDINKQTYTLVKVVNPVVANKTELSKVVNADGSTTITYSDGSTSIVAKV